MNPASFTFKEHKELQIKLVTEENVEFFVQQFAGYCQFPRTSKRAR